MHNIDSILKPFLKWEYDENMFAYKIGKIKIWDIIRIDVYRILVGKETGTFRSRFSNVEKGNKTKRRIGKGILGCFNFNAPYRFKQADILFMNASRRHLIEGFYVSPFIDDLLEDLEYDYCVLETSKRGQGWGLVKTKNLHYYDPSDFYGKIPLTRKEVSDAKRLINKIEHDFNVTFEKYEKKRIILCIVSVVSNRDTLKTYYRFVLMQVRPKIIFIVAAAMDYNKYMIETAKEMKILTVELPHGRSSPYMVDYIFYKKMNIKTHPDYRMFYNEYESNCCKTSSKTITVGNAYNESRVKKFLELKERKNLKDKKKVILIISDENVGSRLDELANQISQMLDEQHYRIEFKIRPLEKDWRQKYPCLRSSNVKVVGYSDRGDIYDCFARADFVIGSTSTALYEAVPFPVKIYVYKTIHHEESESLFKNGYAKLVSDANEIVKDVVSFDGMEKPNKDVSKIFLPNAKQNFKNEIKRLMKVAAGK